MLHSDAFLLKNIQIMNVSLTNISKTFQKTKVLNGLNLEIKSGEIVAILGSSGSGKSTLLNIIAGFERSNSGEVIVNDKVLSSKEKNIFIPPEQRNIGYLFQNFALFPHMSVHSNIAFGIKKNKGNKRKIVQELLGLVGLSGHEKRYPHELSGGQQQRVALARALAPSPGILLLDEPFSGLDADLRISTRDEVGKILHKANATAILVTHDLEEAFAIADYVAVMHKGIIEQIDIPYNIYNLPASRFVANFVGQADFIDGTIVAGGIETELGLFPNDTSLPAETNGQLMMRAENLFISPEPDGEAVIVRRYFKGSENLYCLKLPSGQLIHCVAPPALIIEPDTRVKVDTTLPHIMFFI